MSSNVLGDLISGRNPVRYGTNADLAAALDKKRQETSAKIIDGLVDLLDEFVQIANQSVIDHEDALRAASDAGAYRVRVQEALEYFGTTNVPLPFFRVTFNVEAGRDWCMENNIEIPNIKDTSSAWFIQPIVGLSV